MAISDSTYKNWKRLGTNAAGRLTSRANKSKSKKRFIPKERCTNPKTPAFISLVHSIFKAENADMASVMFSLCLEKLLVCGVARPLVDEFILKRCLPRVPALSGIPMPEEFDLLGTVYQSLLEEREKNRCGSYYTPQAIVREMVDEIGAGSEKTFFDPCCGSGAFLIEAARKGFRVYGADNDRIAVMIAQANLLCEETKRPGYAKARHTFPSVVCADFLALTDSRVQELFACDAFDAIASNPPWGAKNKSGALGTREDSAASFFFKALDLIKKGGLISFLLPSALLNVNRHAAFRRRILEECRIENITVFPEQFTGVQTSFFSLTAKKSSGKTEGPGFTFQSANGRKTLVSEKALELTEQANFLPIGSRELEFIERIRARGTLSLKGSRWALGIVTGDNKRFLQKEPFEGSRAVITGKDVQPFELTKAGNHLLFDRSSFQQCAKDEFFDCPQKLIYRFISRRPVFALDKEQSLVLNSANILIPEISGLSAYSVLGLLNSTIFAFVYQTMFNELKVLRGNLEKLPFPELTQKEDAELTKLVKKVISGALTFEELDAFIFNLYGFSEKQKETIGQCVLQDPPF